MDLNALTLERAESADERAVSPVIGIVLMVGITVIMAAIIGGLVMGLVPDQPSQPTVTLEFQEHNETVTIAHAGGDDFDAAGVTITGNGMTGEISATTGDDSGGVESNSWDNSTSTGDSITLAEDSDGGLDSDGGEIQVVWNANDRSTILDRFEYGGAD
ncbi:type IV pilin [Halostagnicola kamekurae]|uniref:Flagellin N-terminal-like domain-containing protein n=1 Tax=Halostagnicola kamekurae TaxID=619731 RepID=A0A1I6PGC2_9EURY|nr:type IV pilin N-terminal domain-containing protein [Halostagnicola kamekurae]SFS39220.1 flagellin N-terminal-like domain-containing protein [Halostagnicola kamekurae]